MMDSNQIEKLFSRVDIPTRVEDACIQGQIENSCFVSGGTLLQANWELGLSIPEKLISLESIEAMRGVFLISMADGEYLKIGALTTLTECIQHPLIMKYADLLSSACRHIAAPAVRNRGTIGGNIASRSGDSIPALLVQDVKMTIYQKDRYSVVSLEEWLQQMTPSIICSILIPIQKEEVDIKKYYRKVGRREAFTPALVSVSAYCKIGKRNRLTDIRLAIGGGQHRPIRLADNEFLLEGTMATPELLETVYGTVYEEIQSYTDSFATAKYRKTVAANLLLSFLNNCINNR